MMKSRMFFRENGCVIQTRGTARDGLWVVVAVVVLLLLLGWGHRMDRQADDHDQFEAGVAVGVAQGLETVASAYHQGLADAQAQATGCQPGAAPAPGLLTGGRP